MGRYRHLRVKCTTSGSIRCRMSATCQPDAPAKPATDTSVKIKAFPPSIQVGAAAAAVAKDTAKDNAEAPTSEGKHEASVRLNTDDDFDFDAFNTGVKKVPWVIALIFLV